MKEIAQTFALEALKGIQLDFDQIGEFDVNGDARITLAGQRRRHSIHS